MKVRATGSAEALTTLGDVASAELEDDLAMAAPFALVVALPAEHRAVDIAVEPAPVPRGTRATPAPSPLQMAAAMSAQLADMTTAAIFSQATPPAPAVPAEVNVPSAPFDHRSPVALPEPTLMRVASAARTDKSASVRIEHPTLGRIQLEITIDRGAGMRIRVIAGTHAAVAAVRAAESAIRAGIAQHGIKLTRMRVATEETRTHRKKRRPGARNAFDMEA